MNHLTLLVKPVEKESVQNRHEQPVLTAVKEDGNYKIKATPHKKRYFRAEGHTSIKFLIDRKTGKYKTGLEEVISNPLHKMDSLDVKRQYNLPDSWSKDNLLDMLVSKDTITRQAWYEILDGMDPGSYHNEPQNNMLNFIIGAQREVKPKSLIEQFEYTLYNHGSNSPSTETSRGRLAIQALRNQPTVALSKDEINPQVHDWYIAHENEAENERYKMDELVNDAIAELQSLKKSFTPFDLYRIGVVMMDHSTRTPVIKGEVNDNVVRDRLSLAIKTVSKAQEKNIGEFLKVAEMFRNQPELFQLRYMARQGENSGLLYNRDGAFYWRSQANNPAWHKWKNAESFISKMMLEAGEPEKDNMFHEFEAELKNAGIRTR